MMSTYRKFTLMIRLGWVLIAMLCVALIVNIATGWWWWAGVFVIEIAVAAFCLALLYRARSRA